MLRVMIMGDEAGWLGSAALSGAIQGAIRAASVSRRVGAAPRRRRAA